MWGFSWYYINWFSSSCQQCFFLHTTKNTLMWGSQTVWIISAFRQCGSITPGGGFSRICINLVHLLVSYDACWGLDQRFRPIIQSVSSSVHLAHCCRSQINQANVRQLWYDMSSSSLSLVFAHCTAFCLCLHLPRPLIHLRYTFMKLISGGGDKDLACSPSPVLLEMHYLEPSSFWDETPCVFVCLVSVSIVDWP